MITKEDAKIKLMKSGYTVAEDNSVLTVIIPEDGSIKNTVKNVKELFLKIGYEASFGVKQHKFAAGDEDEYMNASVLTDDNESDDMAEAKEMPMDDDDTESKIVNDSKTDTEASKSDDEEEYYDEEDENPEDIGLEIDDMDMLLNENSVQFSLEDFGMM